MKGNTRSSRSSGSYSGGYGVRLSATSGPAITGHAPHSRFPSPHTARQP